MMATEHSLIYGQPSSNPKPVGGLDNRTRTQVPTRLWPRKPFWRVEILRLMYSLVGQGVK